MTNSDDNNSESRRGTLKALGAGALAVATAGVAGAGPAEAATFGRARNMKLSEFLAQKLSPDIEAVLSKLNGGSLMDCHRRFYEATGIWFPELTPVFERMDAALAFRSLPEGVH
ncbi:MAG: hypothetical protein WDN01_06935 [Rhizomicrobium sp.]